MPDVEHWLSALRQNKPVVGVQEAVSPHSHAAAFREVPPSFEQTCAAAHLLRDEVQKRPVVGVQVEAPQVHAPVFSVMPSVLEQSGPEAQRHLKDLVYMEHLAVVSVFALK